MWILSAFIGFVGWAFFVVITTFGLLSSLLAARFAWLRLKAHRAGDRTTAVLTALTGIVCFSGLWVLFDLAWVVRTALRVNRRMAVSRTRVA